MIFQALCVTFMIFAVYPATRAIRTGKRIRHPPGARLFAERMAIGKEGAIIASLSAPDTIS